MKSSSLQIVKSSHGRHDGLARHHTQPFPQTDYHYQATAGAVAPRQAPTRIARPDLREFRKISSDFMAAETHRDYAAEAVMLAVVAGLAAWGLVSLLILLAQTAPG
jgi:hypothetical protein